MSYERPSQGRERKAAIDSKRNAGEELIDAVPHVLIEVPQKLTPEQRQARKEIERNATNAGSDTDSEELSQIEQDNAESIEENARSVRNAVIEQGLSISNAITVLRDAGWSESEVLEMLIPAHMALRAKGETAAAILEATIAREENKEKGRKAMEALEATIRVREQSHAEAEKAEAEKLAHVRELGKKAAAILEATLQRVETKPGSTWTEPEEMPRGREIPVPPSVEQGPFVKVETKRSQVQEGDVPEADVLTEEDFALADSRAEAREALRKMVEMGRGALFDAPIVNKFNIEIPAGEPHLYEGPGGGELLAFGGMYPERLKLIEAFLGDNPDKVVLASDEADTNRVAWSLVNGALTESAVLGKGGWLGSLLGTKLSPPGPDELTKKVL